MAMTTSSDMVRKIRKSLHELAQPLAALTGLVDLLLLEMDAADPISQEVQLMSEQLEKALHIVGEIRCIAREASPGEPIQLSTPQEQVPGERG